jgi:ABC-type multidrug transport system ATPase subunit
LSARANLEFFGGLGGLWGKRLRDRIVYCARLFDLESDLDRLYGTFSTGMRHRLALARALLSDGAVLVLDEPTRAIDPSHAAEIRALIRDRLAAREGKTVIVASNSLEEVHELCDHVAVLENGIVSGTRPAAAVLHEQRLRLASGQ